jgi:hypothetical protein
MRSHKMEWRFVRYLTLYCPHANSYHPRTHIQRHTKKSTLSAPSTHGPRMIRVARDATRRSLGWVPSGSKGWSILTNFRFRARVHQARNATLMPATWKTRGPTLNALFDPSSFEMPECQRRTGTRRTPPGIGTLCALRFCFAAARGTARGGRNRKDVQQPARRTSRSLKKKPPPKGFLLIARKANAATE